MVRQKTANLKTAVLTSVNGPSNNIKSSGSQVWRVYYSSDIYFETEIAVYCAQYARYALHCTQYAFTLYSPEPRQTPMSMCGKTNHKFTIYKR